MNIDRWSVLSAGFLVAIVAMIAINRLPGVSRPEIGENRVLATLPVVPSNATEVADYPKKLDAYVADNFPARPYFIAGLNYLRYKAGYSGTSSVFVGRDGWLFFDSGSHLDQARNAGSLSAKHRRAWVTTLAGRVEKLRADKMVYAVLSAPDKELVYPEKLPAWGQQGHGDAEVLEADARAVNYPNVLAPRSILFRERSVHADVYTRYDTHWSGYGARAVYLALCSKLTELGFPMEPIPVRDFTLTNAGSENLGRMLGISAFISPHFPRYQHPVEAGLKVTYLAKGADPTAPRIVETGLSGKPTVLATMDSFGPELLNSLYPHFSRLILTHPKDGFHRQDLISAYHPDVVLLEVIESGFRHAMSPSAEPGPEGRRRIGDYFRDQW